MPIRLLRGETTPSTHNIHTVMGSGRQRSVQSDRDVTAIKEVLSDISAGPPTVPGWESWYPITIMADAYSRAGFLCHPLNIMSGAATV